MAALAEQFLEIECAILALATCDFIECCLYAHSFAFLADQLILLTLSEQIISILGLLLLMQRVIDNVQVVLGYSLRLLGNGVQYGIDFEISPFLVIA